VCGCLADNMDRIHVRNTIPIIGGADGMTTKNKRDLAADLAICEAATAGPVDYFESIDSEYEYEVCRKDLLDTIIASVITDQDARFIAEAFEGWPVAIRRAMAAEKSLEEETRMTHRLVECADAASKRANTAEAEVALLKSELIDVYQRAQNDVRRRDGGMCVGTVTFADHSFAKRLVRDLEPILFPEVTAHDTQENNGR
jgi:alkylated DNA nucleotide flippase Atl1